MGYSSWISGSVKRSDVEKHLDALFEAAVVEESVDVVQYLLKKGAQPPKGHRKETDTAEKEKERGFVWVDMIDTAFLCSTPDAKEKADLLIKKCGYNGVVPADWVNFAIENGKVGFLKAVLTTGKDYYKPNAHQCDHLHFAVDRKNPNLEVLQIFLDAHLEDVNKLSKSTKYAGEAPIHVATRNRSPEAIKLLREHGANVDIKGKNYRRTALHVAVHPELGEVDMKVLDALKGANGNVKDKDGKTPMDFAMPSGNKKVITWLMREAGATD